MSTQNPQHKLWECSGSVVECLKDCCLDVKNQNKQNISYILSELQEN